MCFSTQHTSRLCKDYLTKKQSDGVLHQMTWPPQSHDLNPIEIVWDELDLRLKEKQPTSRSAYVGSPVGKAFQVKLVERMPRVCNAIIKPKGGYFE
jgi:transposase